VILKGRRRLAIKTKTGKAFPWWGWTGFVLLILTWVFAWTRFNLFKQFRIFSFSPQWLSYIIVVNGLTEARGVKSMLRHRPGLLVRLAVASFIFWWFFEYLNRFAQNWYYTGIGELDSWSYFLYASLPFATVLPAVASTFDYVKTFDAIGAGLDDFIRLTIPHKISTILPWMVLILSCFSLFGIGVWPDIFFFSLWVAPLGIILSIQALSGQKTIFSRLAQGRWRSMYCYVFSALICGFFWEMWNMFSVAKWHYSIPFVEQFRIFEMPLLGYAGYLPFGLECFVIVDMLKRGIAGKKPVSV